jgi:hypothetical protein
MITAKNFLELVVIESLLCCPAGHNQILAAKQHADLASTNLHERVNPGWRLVSAPPRVVHRNMGFRVTRAVATALWRAMWQNGNNRR